MDLFLLFYYFLILFYSILWLGDLGLNGKYMNLKAAQPHGGVTDARPEGKRGLLLMFPLNSKWVNRQKKSKLGKRYPYPGDSIWDPSMLIIYP